MRTLVIGAGALGGYYGACLVRAGRDVTFLVRPRRAEQLARNGLQVVSPHGDFTVPAKTVLAGGIDGPFDLVLVGTKSYSLAEAMEQFAPAVGPGTAILPILNGMAHLDQLSARFGAGHVLGGTAMISGMLDAEGRVLHLFASNDLTYGELQRGVSDRVRALERYFEGAGFNAVASGAAMQAMWEKWVLLATNAGITSMMRASLAEICSAQGGADAIRGLFQECQAVAAASGFPPGEDFVARYMGMIGKGGTPLKASMLRDIERGSVTEGGHILGDLLGRAEALGIDTAILRLAHTHVATYEAILAGAQRKAA